MKMLTVARNVRNTLAGVILTFSLAALAIEDVGSKNIDQSTPMVRLSDGLEVTLVVQGRLPRSQPKSVIVVCSDNADGDIAWLKKAAKALLPQESYMILDGSKLSEKSDLADVTFVYLGNEDGITALSDCLRKSPGFEEYVKLKSRLNKEDIERANVQLKAQFKSKTNVLGPAYCGSDGPIAEIDGARKNWSVQLRNPSGENLALADGLCFRPYFAVFGITDLCTTMACGYDESFKVFESIEKIKID